MREEFHKNSQGFTFTLTKRQELAIQELLNPANKKIEEIASKVRVSRRCLYNWLKLPHFRQRLDEEKNRITQEAFDKLRGSLNKSVETLGELLGSQSDAMRLKACQMILDYNIRLIEVQEIEKRLTNLEKQNLDKRVGGGKP